MLLDNAAATANAASATTWSHPDEKQRNDSVSMPKTKTNDPMQALIEQVCSILPGLGEGYVEMSLSIYKGNVEETISALLTLDAPDAQQRLPSQLLITDRNLPRRRFETEQKAQMEQEEAKQVAKATLRAVEQQQAQEAALLHRAMVSRHDEYDDDHDDQWDDTEGVVFGATMGADSGLYDDYTAVKTYNKVYREMEQDNAFWEDNRNTNRSNPVVKGRKNAKENGNAEGEKSFRGPDKLKGGRIPNPNGGRGGRGRGGRGGRGRKNKTDSGAANDGAGDNHAGEDNQGNTKNDGNNNDTNNNNNKNTRRKARTLANRRDQQKKAMYKKSG